MQSPRLNLGHTLRGILVVSYETFILLRRGKAFLPALICGVAVTVAANLVSDWSIDDLLKILFDIGAFGFHVTGALVAIFWGTKAVIDSRQDGSMEVQLAAPLSRSAWILGRFLGLAACLILLSVILVAIWQAVMLFNYFGWMTWRQGAIFGFLTLLWMIVAAEALFFATFCSTAVAIFASLCLWIAGLFIGALATNVPQRADALTKTIIEFLANYWNLGRYNLSAYAAREVFPPEEALRVLAGQGLLTICCVLLMTCIVFHRRNITPN